MNFDDIVDEYIREYRDDARDEMSLFRKLPSLRHAIRRAALCYRPDGKRHSHQCRIPGHALHKAERTLQRLADRLSRCKDFDALHDTIASAIEPIRKIGGLAVYDIAHRIGAYLKKSPRRVYLHRGTAIGARYLGFKGETLDPAVLPPAFARLTPAEIEDCLCIYRFYLAGIANKRLNRGSCRPARVSLRSGCERSVVRRAVCV